MTEFSIDETRAFFANSEVLDYFVLRPLAHIRANWEISWDDSASRYEPEEDSFAEHLNVLIDDIVTCEPPLAYHDHEDRLAERCRDELKWPICKRGKRWVGVEDYHAILDRLTHHCDIIETGNDSWRFKNREAA